MGSPNYKLCRCVLVFGMLVLVTHLCRPALALEPAPVLDFNMDLSPRLRWRQAVSLVLSRHPWSCSFGPQFDLYNRTIYRLMNDSLRTAIANSLQSRWPNQYEELAGMAESFALAGHAEVDATFLCFSVWYHELWHAEEIPKLDSSSRAPKDCTGVIVMPPTGALPMVHTRNMDQGFNVAASRNLTLQLRVIKNQVLVYEVADFYWFTSGWVTAWRRGVMNLEENGRFSEIPLKWHDIVARILYDPSTVPQVFMFRQLLESPSLSIESAAKYLMTATFASPFYAILSTWRVGVVLTVSWNPSANSGEVIGDAAAARRINDAVAPKNLSVKFLPNAWYIAQGNDDRGNKGGTRGVAERALEVMGQEYAATRLGAWLAIDEYPVHGVSTLYTVLMDVSSNTTRAFIRTPMVPK